MTLTDLLTSYKQVETPTYDKNIDIKPDDRYSRFASYVESKRTEPETSEESDTEQPTYGWQGWSYSGNTRSNETPSTQPTGSSTTPKQSDVTSRQSDTAPRTNRVRAIQTSNKQAYDKFVEDFDNYLRTNQQYQGDRDVLTSIAALESAYSPAVSNAHSSALGYFQFLDSTRHAYNNSTRESFANDTAQQFDAAIKHYENIKKQLSKYQTEIKNSGLSDLQVAYGMWWRPASMIKYLKTGKDDYVNQSDGMTLEKILQRAS